MLYNKLHCTEYLNFSHTSLQLSNDVTCLLKSYITFTCLEHKWLKLHTAQVT